MEYSVVKIIDGMLITDTSILNDQEFLYNNKVSHIFAWVSSNMYLNTYQYEDIGIKAVSMGRVDGVTVPGMAEIQVCVRCLEDSKDQLLCCLICCENIAYGLGLLAPYFICRFGWSFQTAIGFLEQRIKNIKINNCQEYLQNLRLELPRKLPNIASNDSKLRVIEWNFNFLRRYEADDMEQLIIINTVKNTLVEHEAKVGQTQNRKKKRIQWFDELVKNSITAGQRLFANSKINHSLKRTSSLKNYEPKTSIKLSNGDQLLISKPQVKIKQDSSKKLTSSLKQNQFEDLQYLSLKQMSRTNFDDVKFRSGLRKRKHLKVFKKSTEKSKKQLTLKPVHRSNDNGNGLTLIKGIKVLDIENC